MAREITDWTTKFSAYANRIEPSAIFALVDMPQAKDTINLGPGEPDPRFFPAEKLNEIISRELSDEDRAKVALQYTVNAGLPALRQKIAAYHTTKGLDVTAGNVLIASGSQQAIDLIVSAFLEPGQKMAVQTPTYPGAMGIFKAHGADICTLEQALEDEPDGLAIIYLTPTFSNPSGETLDVETRERIIQLAQKTGALIIEDDAYETMSYDGEPPALVQVLDANGDIENSHTLYTSTFSKSLTPGFRVGWLIGPKVVVDKLTLLKQSEDMQAGTLSQVVAAQAIDFVMHEHVPNLRAEYVLRRDAMLTALETHCGNMATWTKPAGGFFVWMTLPENIDAMELLRVAAMKGVMFVPGIASSHDGSYRNSLRLSFSNNSPERLEVAIERLAEAIREFI